ncbi:hypothetical protein [Chitinophaga sp. RAB17]|uniref:hypothetical protein n=1 Tax=Chitinophaga sp. RAB17 TaxID=3233049 RepID=UPI003F92DF9F
MASGFIIIKDGRCFSRKSAVYDYIISIVIKELRMNDPDNEFGLWLASLIPGEKDIDIGYGFIRHDTGEELARWLDLGEITEANQLIFWSSLQHFLNRNITDLRSRDESTYELLIILLKMNYLADTGDDPDNLSDWHKGYTEPYTNNRIGPGW